MLLRRTNWPTWHRRSPFEELDRMRSQMDQIFGGISKALTGEPAAGVYPMINLTEDNDNYYVRAELPGVSAGELDISVTGDTLSISGERNIPIENEQVQYHRREREAGKFNRILSLPGQVNSEKVDAKCTNGLLTITLPKAEEAKPKQISVKTG